MARYDVFLCFRGRDTRHTFTGNLYAALQQARFRTFMDDDELKGADQIAYTIVLEASRISIVVLSEHFAFSSWCLDELAKIVDCMNTKNQAVFPIFYEVDPFYVRHLKGSFGEAMVAHEARFGKDSERVEKWRSALIQVTNLSGWCFARGRWCEYEYEFIERIVQHVTKLVPRYRIFVSFSGKDTRSFTGFLCNALSRSGYNTFISDGEQSSQSTVGVIEKSRLSIIVFSENYARSPSCLDELLRVLECMEMKNQLVCPIFYKVLPSDLRHQRRSYGEAMIEHENVMGENSEKVKKWRSALFHVANLKGWCMKTGYEYEFIEKIVEMASKI
ncbi:protein PHLOEM PROTEIN 2-LIKE A8 isoform X1 [Vigna radiata var. radiata]|uniref:Protein PHLOEM PROTEIN 2-LIKE A8 isoform X1 n=2 Tax=Vigna radiata var. radiata TaxID=3916 RepID=A0A3Q0F248_VIGRR|nr:protein PHLOEM PROTEIN 2-LIKE A8 isoform X1 [Vigna radiata var. radiata]